VDYGGPGELVTPTSGLAIPMGTREQIVANLREILNQLVQSPHRLAPLSAQAVKRSRELFSWPAKARQTLEVYRWVLGRRATKPDLRIPLADPDVSLPSGRVPVADLAF
jgi:alpha-maltose-1-phosphate synthase